MEQFTREELLEALRAIDSKLKEGTAQHTLLVRRIRALRIAAELIRRESEG